MGEAHPRKDQRAPSFYIVFNVFFLLVLYSMSAKHTPWRNSNNHVHLLITPQIRACSGMFLARWHENVAFKRAQNTAGPARCPAPTANQQVTSVPPT